MDWSVLQAPALAGVLMVPDIIVGFAGSVKNKDMQSNELISGLWRKAGFVGIIALAYVIQYAAQFVDLGLIRFKDSAAAAKCASAMQAAVSNMNIGYDQGERNTLLPLARAAGWDLARVTSACETDCSALAGVCGIAAGAPESAIYQGRFCLSALRDMDSASIKGRPLARRARYLCRMGRLHLRKP